MSDTFSSYHPLVNFLFFALIFVFSMLLMHPVCLAVSLCCAFLYSVCLHRGKAARFGLKFMLPMLILTALINPAFNHEGMTVLTYLPSGNPLTLESILYGIAAAVMLITVVSWFSCMSAVITSDKLVYLLGRAIPALSLVLSMSLRFVPRLRAQARVISNAQKCIGRDAGRGTLLQRARRGLRILSILITWALENAIDTADSMKSRGYGIPGRTSFAIYKLTRRDVSALLWLFLCGGYLALGMALGGLKYRYFPALYGVPAGILTYSLFTVYLALGLTPVIINLWEDRKWKAIASKT